MVTRRSSLKSIVEEGVDLIRLYHRIEETKTDTLRRLAAVVVELRRRFTNDEGTPDWAGRSWEYRQTVTTMYEVAGVPPDSVDNIQAALRYHVGNLLRETVDPEELEACGLLAASPRERIAAHRHEVSALLDALTESLPKTPGGKGLVRLTMASETVLDRLVTTFEEVGPVEPEAADAAWEAFERLWLQVERLRTIVHGLDDLRASRIETKTAKAARVRRRPRKRA